MTRHFVTGATGFVGGALVLRLLRRTNANIVCLVRPGPGAADGGERLYASLAHAAAAYDDVIDPAEIRARCIPVTGDILAASCAVDRPDWSAVDEVWHVAASLKYKPADSHDILDHNVRGTANALDFARQARARVFNYVSTAYVAGNQRGVIREALPTTELVAHNVYEQSKIRAEWLVAAENSLHTRILRPSIVIGHSKTFGATSFTGLYGFIRALHKFRSSQAAASVRLTLRADLSGSINLIPVDVVADNAVRISLSNSSRSIFHLSNASALGIGSCATQLFESLRLPPPTFVENTDSFSPLDHAFHRSVGFYSSYLLEPKTFDLANTADAIGAASSRWPLANDVLRKYTDWYVARLAAERPTRGVALDSLPLADLEAAVELRA